MRAIGNNLVIKKIEKPNETTKGGLILSEKQREDIRFQKAEVIKVGDTVVAGIEIDKEPYHVIRQENVVVVL